MRGRRTGGFAAAPCHERIAELRAFLDADGPAGLPGLVAWLAAAWDCLHGAQATGMAARKLDRIEAAHWRPPVLSFEIERHGDLRFGSPFAERQRWTVDLDRWSAVAAPAGRRRVTPSAPPLHAAAVAAQVAALVARGDWRHPWLRLDRQGGRLRVALGEIAPLGLDPERQRRLRAALDEALGRLGWRPDGTPWRYARAAPDGDGEPPVG